MATISVDTKAIGLDGRYGPGFRPAGREGRPGSDLGRCVLAVGTCGYDRRVKWVAWTVILDHTSPRSHQSENGRWRERLSEKSLQIVR